MIDLSEKYSTIYFTGAQCEVWIGDYKLDEAIEIEGVYNLDQIPIYGYASTHFNTVAPGRVMVHGALIINYKYDGYLYAYIKEARKKQKLPVETILTSEKAIEATPKIITQNPTDPTNKISKEVVSFDPSNLNKQQIQKLQNLYWADNFDPIQAKPRPEFMGPFNIKIKDYRVGYSKDSSTTEKELINCFIHRYATVRRVDGAPVVEIYTFIAKSLI